MSLVDADRENVLTLHQGSLANTEEQEFGFIRRVPAGDHPGVAPRLNFNLAHAQTLDLLTVEINHRAVIHSNPSGVELGGTRILDVELQPEIRRGKLLLVVASVTKLRHHVVFAVAKRRLADLPPGIVKIRPGPLFRGSLLSIEIAPSLLAPGHQPRPPCGRTLGLALTPLRLRAFSLFPAFLYKANGGGQDSYYQGHCDDFHLISTFLSGEAGFLTGFSVFPIRKNDCQIFVGLCKE